MGVVTIFTAISTAAIGAAGVVRNELNQQDGERTGLIINESPYTLNEWSSNTIWGGWNSQPTNSIKGQPSPESLFAAWQNSNEIPPDIEKAVKGMASYKDLKTGQDILFANWASSILKNLAAPPGTFSLVGRGGGVEAVSIYQVEGEEVYFCFYVGGAGGWNKTYAGCAILTNTEIRSYNWSDSPQELADLIEYADGEKDAVRCSTDGNRQTAIYEGWKCVMSSGNISEFTVRATGQG